MLAAAWRAAACVTAGYAVSWLLGCRAARHAKHRPHDVCAQQPILAPLAIRLIACSPFPVTGVSVQANTQALLSMAGLEAEDVVMVEWSNTTFKYEAGREGVGEGLSTRHVT